MARPDTKVHWGPVEPTSTKDLFRAAPAATEETTETEQAPTPSDDFSQLVAELETLTSPPSREGEPTTVPPMPAAMVDTPAPLDTSDDHAIEPASPTVAEPVAPTVTPPAEPAPSPEPRSSSSSNLDTAPSPSTSDTATDRPFRAPARPPRTRRRNEPRPSTPAQQKSTTNNPAPSPLAEDLGWSDPTPAASTTATPSTPTGTPTPAPSPDEPATPVTATDTLATTANTLPVPVTPAQAPRTKQELEEELAREMTTRAALDEEARRQASLAQYTQAVEQILRSAGADPDVARKMRDMELTRDKEIDARQRRDFQSLVEPLLAKNPLTLRDPRDVPVVFDLAYDQMLGLGPLGPLWRDDAITEIMVNAYDQIFVQANGRLYDTRLQFPSRTAVMRLARDLAQRVAGRLLSAENSLVTAFLPGARANFVYGAPTQAGAVITIRKFTPLLGVEQLLANDTLSPDMHDFLRDCVRARANILISGSTDSGKTTLINALSGFIPDDERVITIEDSLELSLTNHHVVALQTKEKASGDDHITISQAELMVNALRMRPDRIIIGEIRDGAAARVFVDAANTGHDGTMTTIHGNSADLVVNDRLVTLLRADHNIPDDVARRTIAAALNLVVQVRKVRGRRLISEIAVLDPTRIRRGQIEPETIFLGNLDENGQPVFTRHAGLRDDTDLARRFDTFEVDATRWR